MTTVPEEKNGLLCNNGSCSFQCLPHAPFSSSSLYSFLPVSSSFHFLNAFISLLTTQVTQALFEERFFGGKDSGFGSSEKNYSAYVLIYERVDFLEAMARAAHPADLLMGDKAAGPSGQEGLGTFAGRTPSTVAEEAEDTGASPESSAAAGAGHRRSSSRDSDNSTGKMAALAARMNELVIADPTQSRSGHLRESIPPSIRSAVALANTQFNFACHLFGDEFTNFVFRLGQLGLDAARSEETNSFSRAALSDPAESAALPTPASGAAAGDGRGQAAQSGLTAAEAQRAGAFSQSERSISFETVTGVEDLSSAALVADFLVRMYFRVYLHLAKRPGVTEVHAVLTKLLRLSLPARIRVCRVLSEAPRILRACLLKAKSEDIRQQAADVVLRALVMGGVATEAAAATVAGASMAKSLAAAGDSGDASLVGGPSSIPHELHLRYGQAQEALLRQLTLALHEDAVEHLLRSSTLTWVLARYIMHGAEARRLAVAAGVDAELLRFLQLEAAEGGRRWSESQLGTFKHIHAALAELVRAADLRPHLAAASWYADSVASAGDDHQQYAQEELAMAREAYNVARNPYAVVDDSVPLDDELAGGAGLEEATSSANAAAENAVDGRAAGGTPALSPALANGLFGNRSWARDLLTHLLTDPTTPVLLRYLAWNNPAFSDYAVRTLLVEISRSAVHLHIYLAALHDQLLIEDIVQQARIEVGLQRGAV